MNMTENNSDFMLPINDTLGGEHGETDGEVKGEGWREGGRSAKGDGRELE